MALDVARMGKVWRGKFTDAERSVPFGQPGFPPAIAMVSEAGNRRKSIKAEDPTADSV